MKRASFPLTLSFILLATALPIATSVALTDQEVMQRTRIDDTTQRATPGFSC